MSRRSNLAYKYDADPEPRRSSAQVAQPAVTSVPERDVLALPDGNAAKGIMLAALAGIGAWSVIGAGVVSVWRLMA